MTLASTANRLAPTKLPLAIGVTGFLSLFLPVYWDAAHGIWRADEHGHAPLVIAAAVFIFWQKLKDVEPLGTSRSEAWLGTLTLLVSLALYLTGRVFEFSSFVFLAQPLALVAIVVATLGRKALLAVWFPLLFLCFSVPLPLSVIEAVTSPLKEWISWLVVEALHYLGLPIYREGVTITIGSYQLLVADACAGLNSMISLSALGLLYLYLFERKNPIHLSIMLLAVLPVAFAANIVRVALLVLITYFLGDEAGQGFVHGASGIAILMASLILLVALDATLLAILEPKRTRPPAQANQ